MRITFFPSQDFEAEEPREVTVPKPSASKGTSKEGEGYRCWRRKRSRWLRAAEWRVMRRSRGPGDGVGTFFRESL